MCNTVKAPTISVQVNEAVGIAEDHHLGIGGRVSVAKDDLVTFGKVFGAR